MLPSYSCSSSSVWSTNSRQLGSSVFTLNGSSCSATAASTVLEKGVLRWFSRWSITCRKTSFFSFFSSFSNSSFFCSSTHLFSTRFSSCGGISTAAKVKKCIETILSIKKDRMGGVSALPILDCVGP